MESKSRPGRKYGFACLICRRRKIRCGGEKPACHNCVKAGSSCSYKAGDALIADLRSELGESQTRIRELEDALRRLALLDHDGRDKLLLDLVAGLGHRQAEPTKPNAGASVGPWATLDGQDAENLPGQGELAQAELSVDEHGELQYFGATSRFHTRVDGNQSLGPGPGADADYHRKWLSSNVRFQASWEKSAYEKLGRGMEISTEAAAVLMNIYWTWQAPLHNWVYRPCFFRDMALGGPYFSPFLLNVMYAHACRHVKADDPRFSSFGQGEYFLAKAKLLLIEELSREKPLIPTIQGLLILGGRQCSVGKSSEGWLYTGMAIRMVKDLGLHLRDRQGALVAKLEPDDLEVAKRLYMSAYTWDKTISLCLGRPPSLPEMPYHPDCLLDHADDDEIWRPFYTGELEDAYPATKGYRTLTFSWFCRLAVLVNEVYTTIYSGRPSKLRTQSVLDLEENLRTFYTTLPDVLRIDDIESRPFCPPPYILCLNITYHTLLILLFRPFIPWSSNAQLSRHALAIRAKAVCVEEAILVSNFFRSYGRTYNFQYQSYLVSYCVYTAATVELQQIQDPDEQVSATAAGRLATTLYMLETEAKQTPGIRRSVDIIKSHLETRSQHAKAAEALQHLNRSAGAPLDTGAERTGADFGTNPPVQLRGAVPADTASGSSDADMSYSSQWLDWGSYDMTAGFVPDEATWSFYDTVWEPR